MLPDPIPWWGRIYVAGVTLLFATIAAYVFRALGRPEVKDHFRLPAKANASALSPALSPLPASPAIEPELSASDNPEDE